MSCSWLNPLLQVGAASLEATLLLTARDTDLVNIPPHKIAARELPELAAAAGQAAQRWHVHSPKDRLPHVSGQFYISFDYHAFASPSQGPSEWLRAAEARKSPPPTKPLAP